MSFGKIDKFGWTLAVDVAGLIMPSLFSSVSSRGRGIPTCVKGACRVAYWKRWFWVKLALITFIATSTTAVDNSTICTSRHLWFLVKFCPFLQRGSIACYAKRCTSYRESVWPSDRLSDRLTVCPSQSGIVSKRLKLGSWDLHCRIAPWV